MIVRSFERRDYLECLEAMRTFTRSRDAQTEDEIWLVEHEQVFTLGLASKPEHVLNLGSFPCIQTERGGQVTFHGPGQVIAYLLLDLRRSGMMVRDLVCRMESALITCSAGFGVRVNRKLGAPGVYVERGAKIASLGIKVSRGCTYHGLALNVDMDLEPFARINPCGYPGLEVTDLRKEQALLEMAPSNLLPQVAEKLALELKTQLTGLT